MYIKKPKSGKAERSIFKPVILYPISLNVKNELPY